MMSRTTFRGLLILGFAATLSVGAASGEAGTAGGDTFQPMQAMSYVLGSKRVAGYFRSVGGRCRVTLMIAEAVDPDVATAPSPARLGLSLAAGEAASVDSVENASIALTCGASAQTVQVSRASTPRS